MSATTLQPGAPDSIAAFDQHRVDNPEARKLESYPALDWLRFVLASIVVLGHDGVLLPAPVGPNLAVSVFLALSGWLIGGILLRSERRDLPRFFFNRATRIWLPYFATFAAIYGLAAVRDGVDLNWLKYAFYDATFTHFTWTAFPRAATEMPLGGTGNHFWSISVEEQFYLFAPLLMFIAAWGKRIAPWIVVAGVLLAMGSRFSPIALGVIAAIVQRDHGDWHHRTPGRVALAIAAAATFALLVWRDEPRTQALFSVVVVVALAQVGRRGRTGLFLGAISYPLYLNAWIGSFAVNAVASRIAFVEPARQALAFAAGLGVATLSWALIDRQVMAQRSGWFTPARGRAVTIAAYALLATGLAGGLLIRSAGG